ncbi:MAG: hypothetical protein ABF633_10350 [Clostridium sp.]
MNQYKYLQEFYITAGVQEKNIIIKDINITGYGNVCIYVVTQNTISQY